MQQHGRKYYTIDPHPEVGSKGQNIFFSEYDHVAHQFKWIHECSNMVTNILPTEPPSTQNKKSKFSFFQNMAMLLIKLKRMIHAATCQQIIFPKTTPTLEYSQNSTFSELGHVAFQIKWNHECSNMQAHILSLHAPSTTGVGSNVKIFFSESSHIAYQIKGG